MSTSEMPPQNDELIDDLATELIRNHIIPDIRITKMFGDDMTDEEIIQYVLPMARYSISKMWDDIWAEANRPRPTELEWRE